MKIQYRLGGLNTEITVLTFLEVAIVKSGCQRVVWWPLPSWLVDGHLHAVSSGTVTEIKLSGTSYKGPNPS